MMLPEINNTSIRLTQDNLLSLNDLHRASNSNSSKKPSEWLRLKSTQELVNAYVSGNSRSPLDVVTTGDNDSRGVWAIEELAIDYAQWINVEFKVKCLYVLREFFHGNLQPKKEMTVLDYAKALVAQAEVVEKLESDLGDAIKAKGQISRAREASVMGKLSAKTRQIAKLENKLQDVGEYRSLIAAGIRSRTDTEIKPNVQSWRLMLEICDELNLPPKKVSDPVYGQVNTYHLDVIAEFKERYL